MLRLTYGPDEWEGSVCRSESMDLTAPLNIPTPSRDSVHLWCVSLAVSDERFDVLASLLSEDERRRAGRFIFEKDQRRFVTARGLLRTILSECLVCRPEHVVFRYDAYGKPALAPVHARDEVSFSVSHTADQAVYAVACDRRVGVDVERVRPVADFDALVRSVFSSRERARWTALPEDGRPEAFFRAWTRKEAYLKAVGTGLSYPMRRVEVTFASDEPARLLRIRNGSSPQSGWSLIDLASATDYVGAVAVEGRPAICSISGSPIGSGKEHDGRGIFHIRTGRENAML